MSRFFERVSEVSRCIHDVFYRTDYTPSFGTKRAGWSCYSPEKGFQHQSQP